MFTGRFQRYDVTFCILALIACWIGRALHLFPLSMCANAFRSPARSIPPRMQVVLWFAGLRGAIAFALAVNMPGANREVYATTTLFICIFTTVVCGSLTDRMLTSFGMKQPPEDSADGGLYTTTSTNVPSPSASTVEHKRPGLATQTSQRVYKGAKKVFFRLNQEILQPYFGGPGHHAPRDQLGNYELSVMTDDYDVDHTDDDPLKGHDDDLGTEANGF